MKKEILELLKNRKLTLSEVFAKLSDIELRKKLNQNPQLRNAFILIEFNFNDLEQRSETNECSKKEYAENRLSIRADLEKFVNDLEDTVFEPIISPRLKEEPIVPPIAGVWQPTKITIWLRFKNYFNRYTKNSIQYHIREDMFLADKYIFFDTFIFDFIKNNGGINFAGIDDTLGDIWTQKFHDNQDLFLKQIKKALSKNAVNCTVFNALNSFITDNKTLSGLDDSQKALGLLLLVSQCVSFVEHHYPNENETFRNEFIKMSNRIIGRIFNDTEFTMVEFKELLSANKKSDAASLRIQKWTRKQFKEFKEMIDAKMGILKDIIKAIFKILESDWSYENSKPQIKADDLECLFNRKNKNTFFIPKKRFTLIGHKQRALERKFLIDFHGFFMKVNGSIVEPHKKHQFNYTFLIQATHNEQFKYRKMSLLMGLSQFWLHPMERHFLGKWLR